MTMLLGEAWERSNFATGKASDIARQLALAGIAVIWLFKTTNAAAPIPTNFLWPLWLFLTSLLLDLLQYLLTGVIWAAFSRRREKQHNSSAATTEITDSPDYINYGSWVVFGLKMVAMTSGYVYLLSSMWSFIRPHW